MVAISLPQSVATGIGPGIDESDLSKTQNTLIKVVKGQYTYNNNLITTFDYLHDATGGPYALRNEKWSFAKQKVAQWIYGDGTEKCIVKYSLDYQYGTMEMETFGRVDKYNVIKAIRLANVTVQDMLNVNVNVYSKVTLVMEGRLELEVVTIFEGLRSGEKYSKVARFLLDATGRFQDL